MKKPPQFDIETRIRLLDDVNREQLRELQQLRNENDVLKRALKHTGTEAHRGN